MTDTSSSEDSKREDVGSEQTGEKGRESIGDTGAQEQAEDRKVTTEEPKRIYRSRKNRVIAGVAGGIGEYLGVDPTLVRLLWLLFFFFGGTGLIAYIIAWIIIPERPEGDESEAATPENSKISQNDAGLIIGLVLVGLGIWFLLNNLNLVPSPFFVFFRFVGQAFLPVLLILLGVLVIMATKRGGKLAISTTGKPIYRSRDNRIIAGVGGGIAKYFEVDPTLVRLVMAAIFVINFPAALIAYIVAVIVIPEEPQ